MAEPEPGAGGERSILKELVLNQYQAIVLAGVAAISALSQSPLPLMVWGGGQLVLLPLLDSRPLRRYVARRREAKARKAIDTGRAVALEALEPTYARRYDAMQHLCSLIEANYQQLTGLSQAYIFEQRGKLNVILDGCLHRLLALQRYEAMLERRSERAIQQQILALDRELTQPGLQARARAALEKNIQLKQQLLASLEEARGTMKALATELDSMESLLEVLHQNSIAMRDPQAVAQELAAIAQQSQDSERVVREMEALVRASAVELGEAPAAGVRSANSDRPRRRARQREDNR
jgi:hypothetical protein